MEGSVATYGVLPLPEPLPLFPPNRRKRWLEFKEDFTDYASSNGLFAQSPTIQLSHFRRALGSQCKSKFRMICASLTIPPENLEESAKKNEPSALLQNTIIAFELDYCGKQNILANREKFYMCNQGSMDVDRFIEKVCELAEDCEFRSASKDEMIRDRLVLGLADDRLKDKLVQSDREDLAYVIQTIRRSVHSASTSAVVAATTSEHEENVNKVRGDRRSERKQFSSNSSDAFVGR